MRESRHKRLTRSSSDRILAGVFGGFGDYFHLSPNILRVAYVVLTILTAMVPGIIIYIILMIIMPPDPQNPGILGIFQTLSGLNKGQPSHDQVRSRRQLKNVEEKDIKRNRRS
jgi:phage shock protein C